MDSENLAADVIDDYTLKVVLETKSEYFLNFLASTGIFMPLREDIIEKYGNEWTSNPDTYICNGQYVISDRVIGEKIVLEENPYYYDKNDIIAKRITFILNADPYYIIDKLLNDKVHFSSIRASKNRCRISYE